MLRTKWSLAGRAVLFATGGERAVGGAIRREHPVTPAPPAQESLSQDPVATAIGRLPPLQEPRGMGLPGGRREAGVQATGEGEGAGRNGRDAGGHTSR